MPQHHGCSWERPVWAPAEHRPASDTGSLETLSTVGEGMEAAKSHGRMGFIIWVEGGVVWQPVPPAFTLPEGTKCCVCSAGGAPPAIAACGTRVSVVGNN